MNKLDDWRDPANGPRFEATTTCVNWSAGRWSQFLPAVGFVVRRPWHWVFAGTGLSEGALLGQTEGVIGYETDAAAFTEDSGYPLATGTNSTPFSFAILGTADLTQPSQTWVDVPGFATLGIAWLGLGMVMTAGTTAWGQGLKMDSGNVHRVTRNSIDRLRNRVFPSRGIIYAANGAGELLFYRDRTRDGTGDVTAVGVIGHGGWNSFRFLFSGGGGIIYAITNDGDLLFYRDHNRDGSGDVNTPSTIGRGGWQSFWSVFSGGDGIIYAITNAGDLLIYRDHTRDGSGDVNTPSTIGHGGWNSFRSVFYGGVSGGAGVLYAITQSGDLLFYRDFTRNGSGDVNTPRTIGNGGWNSFRSVFAGAAGEIYAITQDGKLLFYRDWMRNGTGDVARAQTIGRLSWETFPCVFSGD